MNIQILARVGTIRFIMNDVSGTYGIDDTWANKENITVNGDAIHVVDYDSNVYDFSRTDFDNPDGPGCADANELLDKIMKF